MKLPAAIRKSHSRTLRRIRFAGWQHYCPICGSHLRRFFPHGVIRRPNAQCPVCRSLERHRLLWLFFEKQTSLFDRTSKTVLHVAPEPAFAEHFKRLALLEYVTADLYAPDVMVRMDITRITYPDHSFDIILCNHVLEHVSDDQEAMRELYRVLKPGGWAVLQVPITAPRTFEDPSVTDPAERERVFGQRDHLRRYGPDYVQRLEAAGFAVRCIPATAVVAPGAFQYLGLMAEHTIFYCTKAPDT